MIDRNKLLESLIEACEKDSFKELPSWVINVINKQTEIDRWIPIGQYPDEPSLLCFENGTMVVGYYDYDEWKILTDSEYETTCFGEEPIAWQPLPKPYEVEE